MKIVRRWLRTRWPRTLLSSADRALEDELRHACNPTLSAPSTVWSEVHRFFSYPDDYHVKSGADGTAGVDTHPHLRHILAAQSAAMQGKAVSAAAHMQAALKALEVVGARLDAGWREDPASEYRIRLLRCLGEMFVSRYGHCDGQGKLAKAEAPGTAPASQPPSDEGPRLHPAAAAYLWSEHAELQRQLGSHANAIEALRRSQALQGVAAADAVAGLAMAAARLALESDSRDLLEQARQWILSAAPEASLARIDLEIFRGQVELAVAERSGTGPERQAEAARNAIRALLQARSLAKDGGDGLFKTLFAASESWLRLANDRHWDAEMASGHAVPRQQFRKGLALPKDQRPGHEIGWKDIGDALSSSVYPEHGGRVGRWLAERRPTMPSLVKDRRRLVLEIPYALLGGEPLTGSNFTLAPDHEAAMQRLIDLAAPAMPNFAALRRGLHALYGLDLPGVLLRPRPGRKIVVYLDGVPIGERAIPEPKAAGPWPESQATVPLPGHRHAPEVPDWLESVAPPSDGFPIWVLAAVVQNHLDRFVDGRMRPMGKRLAPARAWMPLVRLLLADRTSLIAPPETANADERHRGPPEALERALCEIVAGRQTPLQAAEALRRSPAFRDRLWGTGSGWTDRRLESSTERALARAVAGSSGAADVPERLAKAIEAQATEHTREDCSRLVLREPALRPWVRALIRHTQPGLPVLAADELAPAHADRLAHGDRLALGAELMQS